MLIIGKYVQIRFKNRAPAYYFLEVKRWKILQKLNLRDYFCNIFGFIFHSVSRAKIDSHSKYIFNFVFGSFFERYHLLTLSWRRPLSYRNQSIDLPSKWTGFYMITASIMNGLNLFILRVYEKRWPKCARISKQNRRTIHWGKKYWDTGLVSEKTEALYAELNETVEAATSSYSATNKFLRYIYSVLVAKNHHKIRSRCLVHKFSFTDIFLNSGLYGCGFLLLLWKGTQKDAHCNCIVPP